MNTYKVSCTFKYPQDSGDRVTWQVRSFDHEIQAANREEAIQKLKDMYALKGISAELIGDLQF